MQREQTINDKLDFLLNIIKDNAEKLDEPIDEKILSERNLNTRDFVKIQERFSTTLQQNDEYKEQQTLHNEVVNVLNNLNKLKSNAEYIEKYKDYFTESIDDAKRYLWLRDEIMKNIPELFEENKKYFDFVDMEYVFNPSLFVLDRMQNEIEGKFTLRYVQKVIDVLIQYAKDKNFDLSKKY